MVLGATGRLVACAGIALAGNVLGAAPLAAQESCHGVACGGHGQCMIEREDRFCFCDEGYAAERLSCLPAAPSPSRERTSNLGGLIVHIASEEGERGIEDVGKSRAEYPFALSRYVAPGRLWCSDFVSWVYRAAGAPFTGGSEGGWMLPNNVAIRRWFERRGLWVAKGTPEWETFTPRPGDYVRIHSRGRWGHSAIVRYVAGDSLYLVEGNAGNRVRLTRYRRYRELDRFDGFGIVTQPDARRARLRDALRALPEATRFTRPPV